MEIEMRQMEGNARNVMRVPHMATNAISVYHLVQVRPNVKRFGDDIEVKTNGIEMTAKSNLCLDYCIKDSTLLEAELRNKNRLSLMSKSTCNRHQSCD